MGQIKLNDISYSGGGGSAVTDLEDLNNVSISTPSDGQVLTYNGTSQEWENQAAAGVDSLSELDDVNISSEQDGDVLRYDATSNKWINDNISLVPFGVGTDEQIAAMINGYYNGDYTLNDIKSVWSIGDTRTIHLDAMAATGVGESHRAQDVQIQILDFDHDTLTTSVNGKTKALITVDLKNCLRDASVADDDGEHNTEHGYMNSTNTNVGGWTSCARRSWCNNVFYASLPSYLKTNVKPVNKLTSAGNQSDVINTDSDYTFLLSEIEIFGSITYSKAGEGSQYAWYANAAANNYKLPKWSSSYVSDGWWERSPSGFTTAYFCSVNGYGNASNNGASLARGLALAFCL